jgi:DNA repair exonuclease SbcCD nuclease subunit
MTPWTFVHVSDIHVGTPRSFRFQPAWNANWQTARRQILDIDPEFLLLGGDLTRDGSTHRFELEQVKKDLDSLPFPYYVIPGNHDVGNKYQPDTTTAIKQGAVDQFREIFGSDHCSFTHKDVRFTGFNALPAGSGIPAETDMWNWLEAQVDQPRSPHHVWFLHPALFVENPEEPNWNVETNRLEWIFGTDDPHRTRMLEIIRKTDPDLVITSHIHCRKSVTIEDLTFQYSSAVAFPQQVLGWEDGDPTLGFLKCDVADAGVTHSFVPLAQVSEEKGYGPGGSPAFEERDYTISWEKPSLKDLGL